MNRVTLSGHVGNDPEVRNTDKGKVANLTFATSESYHDGEEKKTFTEWHRLVGWKKYAEILEKFVKKGSHLLIEGSNRTRTYEKEGQKHYVTEIHINYIEFLDKKTE